MSCPSCGFGTGGAPPPRAPAGLAAGHQKTDGLAIAGFVCAFFVPLIGLILSAVSLGHFKRDPMLKGRGFALAGLIISMVGMVLGILWFIIVASMLSSA